MTNFKKYLINFNNERSFHQLENILMIRQVSFIYPSIGYVFDINGFLIKNN